jgi:hypothetical protein
MKDRILTGLNRILVVDVFFLLIIFIWLMIAFIGKSNGVDLGLDLWLKLWTPVFNPAIGILMLGAIVSGVTNWLLKRMNPDG